ncbi:MAG: recombinase RecT [Muribaculaceae bacterium]|nr:recombinase RecT [Muribaculaceae bacterium]
MSNLALKVEDINKLDKTQIVNDPIVRDKFIEIYNAMWSRTTGTSGEAAYERESRNFNRILSEKEDIRKGCTNFSIFTAFIDVAISGLTLDPGTKAQAYLLARSIPVETYYENGQKKNKYETQCVLTISGYGELVLRARCGQIQYADNPVIVYAEDEFEYGERNGQKYVNYGCRLPHNSGQIVACFMKITRADGSIDYSVMLPEDWTRLAGYSARQNKKWNTQTQRWENGNPNALYGARQDGSLNIDTGFLIAKCIKHAFKAYPKARIGRGTQLESQQVDDVEINEDIYGVVDTQTGEVRDNPPEDTGFAPANDFSEGVTVETNEEDTF